MSGICLPIDAVSGSPSFPAAHHRVAQGALLLGRTDRPLGAVSGVRPGSDPTVTVSPTNWTVPPFTAIVDPGTAEDVGAYLVAFLTDQIGAIAPANSTLDRVDRLDIMVPDDPPGGDPLNAWIEYTEGTPGLAAAPDRSTPLGQISVPHSGTGDPSYASSKAYTVASGGILPVTGSSQYPASPYVGQYIDDATLGMLRWNGSVWASASLLWQGHQTGVHTTSLANNAVTTIPMDALDVNTTGVGVGGGSWRAPAGMIVRVSGVVMFSANATGSRGGDFALNGTPINGSNALVPAPGTGLCRVPLGTVLVTVAANDVISMEGYQNSGGSLATATGPGSSFNIQRV